MTAPSGVRGGSFSRQTCRLAILAPRLDHPIKGPALGAFSYRRRPARRRGVDEGDGEGNAETAGAGNTAAPLHWRVGRRGCARGRARRPERARPRVAIRARIVGSARRDGRRHGVAWAGRCLRDWRRAGAGSIFTRIVTRFLIWFRLGNRTDKRFLCSINCPGGPHMAEYLAYILDEDGHVSSAIEFVCPDFAAPVAGRLVFDNRVPCGTRGSRAAQIV